MPTVSHSWKASVPIAGVRHLTGDADHRDRVHEGVHQRRDEVGGRRARGHHRHAGLAGDVGVALGHVAGALLVAHQHVADRRFEQWVVGGKDAPARQAEHHVDVLELERSDQRLGSGHSGHCCLLVGERGRSGETAGKTKRPPVWEVVAHAAGEAGALVDEYYEGVGGC